MACIRNFLICAAWTVIGLLGVSASANADCATLAGTWYFYDMQEQGPNIKTKFTPFNGSSLETFAFTKSYEGYTNNTTTVVKCTMTVKGNGNFTAPCTAYNIDGTFNVNVAGRLTLSACNFGGTINIPGVGTPIVIQGGHLNGNVGAGIATQGIQYHHFSLVKE